MNKTVVIFILVLIAAAGALYIWNSGSLPSTTIQPTPTPMPTAAPDNLIRVSAPKPGDTVTSPMHIEGEARGNWYFEASFPAEIIDTNGNSLAIFPVQAGADWMTTEFVPFSADIPFKTPSTETGTLILHKDNPSGLPEHEDRREIPIKFDLKP